MAAPKFILRTALGLTFMFAIGKTLFCAEPALSAGPCEHYNFRGDILEGVQGVWCDAGGNTMVVGSGGKVYLDGKDWSLIASKDTSELDSSDLEELVFCGQSLGETSSIKISTVKKDFGSATLPVFLLEMRKGSSEKVKFRKKADCSKLLSPVKLEPKIEKKLCDDGAFSHTVYAMSNPARYWTRKFEFSKDGQAKETRIFRDAWAGGENDPVEEFSDTGTYIVSGSTLLLCLDRTGSSLFQLNGDCLVTWPGFEEPESFCLHGTIQEEQ